MKEIEISVIIPVFNNERTIPELIKRCIDTLLKCTTRYEIICINDGSHDNSLKSLKAIAENDKRVYYINFNRNFGQQVAISAGLDHCQGKSVVIIDSDLQDPPELIYDLYQKYKEGYDVVYAKRIARKGENFLKKATAKLFYRFLSRITSFYIPIDTGEFRIIDSKVVECLRQMKEQNKFLRGQIAWLGFKQTEVKYVREKRKFGRTGYSFGKLFTLAMDAITGFSDAPLKFVTRLGLTVAFFSFIIILYAFYSHYILHRTITGWTSIIISTMFIGGVQLISIGIIGEYISRLNKNILNRPLYIIESSNMNNI